MELIEAMVYRFHAHAAVRVETGVGVGAAAGVGGVEGWGLTSFCKYGRPFRSHGEM